MKVGKVERKQFSEGDYCLKKNYFLGAYNGAETNHLQKEDKQDDFQACGSFQTSNFIGSVHQK